MKGEAAPFLRELGKDIVRETGRIGEGYNMNNE
jgi:hypothetical protein